MMDANEATMTMRIPTPMILIKVIFLSYLTTYRHIGSWSLESLFNPTLMLSVLLFLSLVTTGSCHL